HAAVRRAAAHRAVVRARRVAVRGSRPVAVVVRPRVAPIGPAARADSRGDTLDATSITAYAASSCGCVRHFARRAIGGEWNVGPTARPPARRGPPPLRPPPHQPVQPL